jgi:uncharacterized RDD family membrane protein YckC
MSVAQENPKTIALSPRAADDSAAPRAGFWLRFGAAVMDAVMLLIIAFVLIAAFRSLAAVGVAWVVGIAYFTYFEGGPRGQTLGKRAMGIRVVDLATGGPIGYGRGFVRCLGRNVSGVAVYIGYLWVLWDREKQAWHDKFAANVVVPALRSSGE